MADSLYCGNRRGRGECRERVKKSIGHGGRARKFIGRLEFHTSSSSDLTSVPVRILSRDVYRVVDWSKRIYSEAGKTRLTRTNCWSSGKKGTQWFLGKRVSNLRWRRWKWKFWICRICRRIIVATLVRFVRFQVIYEIERENPKNQYRSFSWQFYFINCIQLISIY